MSAKDLVSQIKDLSLLISQSIESLTIADRNEEWTKAALIFPLLEQLGWDRARDVRYENSPQDIDGRIDMILKCDSPIGIEAKALDVQAPKDLEHHQIKKGLKQANDRGAKYFIWTNGDTWQFYSLSLPEAPIYQIILSSANDSIVNTEEIVNSIRIIDKKLFIANPLQFDNALKANWKLHALPFAWHTLLDSHIDEILCIFRKLLPSKLNISDDEIKSHLKSLEAKEAEFIKMKIRGKKVLRERSFPGDWEQLLNSFEPEYEGAKKRFQLPNYRKLAEFLISEKYKPWSKSTTWRYVGLSDDANEKKKLGPVITLFKDWKFIEDKPSSDMYLRVEDSIPFLGKLIRK